MRFLISRSFSESILGSLGFRSRNFEFNDRTSTLILKSPLLEVASPKPVMDLIMKQYYDKQWVLFTQRNIRAVSRRHAENHGVTRRIRHAISAYLHASP